MKKALRIILWVLAIIVAVVLVTGLVAPKDVTIERTVVINAPKDVVFEQIRYFKNSNKWSPWPKMDPNIKIEYKGTDGEPGSSYVWEGNRKVGKGEMINMGINDYKLDYAVRFGSSQDTSMGFMKAADTAGMAKVTWQMNMHVPFPMNAICALIGMKKMMSKDFDKGLADLKATVEANPVKSSGASSADVQ